MHFVENYKTLEKTTKHCRKLQSQPPSPNKESRERKNLFLPLLSIIKKERDKKKLEDLQQQQLCAYKDAADDAAVLFSSDSLSNSSGSSSIPQGSVEDGG